MKINNMKNLLNKIAIWLYSNTKERPTKPNILYGCRIFYSDHLPKDTIYMASDDAKEVNEWFLDNEIRLETKK